jgi:hypothetical protein
VESLIDRCGVCRGVPIIFRASCEEEKDQWVETLRRLMKFPSAQHLAPLSYFAKLRREVYQAYMGPTTQVCAQWSACFPMSCFQMSFGPCCLACLSVRQELDMHENAAMPLACLSSFEARKC